jgi:chaperonin cofactor prefoldin
MPTKTNDIQERLQQVESSLWPRLQDAEQKLAKLQSSSNKLKDDYAVLQSNYNNLVNDINRRLEDLNKRVNTFQQ